MKPYKLSSVNFAWFILHLASSDRPQAREICRSVARDAQIFVFGFVAAGDGLRQTPAGSPERLDLSFRVI